MVDISGMLNNDINFESGQETQNINKCKSKNVKSSSVKSSKGKFSIKIVDEPLNIFNSQIKKLMKKEILGFGLKISEKYNENACKYKKELVLPNEWNKLTEWNVDKFDNGIGILTGNKNKLFVLDIDNLNDWNNLLDHHNQKEPNTVSASSGNGGIHLYFKYNDKMINIPSSNKCLSLNGKKLDIDVKNNDGFIIAPPSYYNINNTNEIKQYEWINSIFDHDLQELPEWLFNLLTNIKGKSSDNSTNACLVSHDLVKELIGLLNEERCENYDDWLHVGMCLFNIDDKNIDMWIEWSKSSKKFVKGACEKKWKSFVKDGSLTTGSLIYWLKMDNYDEYVRLFKNDVEMFELITKEDEGLGQLFVDIVKHKIKIIDDQGNGYIFEIQSKLWIKSSRNDIKDLITIELEPIIIDLLNRQRDDPKKQKKLKSILTYIRRSSGVSNVFNKIFTRLKDYDFIRYIDKNPDFLPIKGNMKINLKTGERTERTFDDYFSFECPINYVTERKNINKFMKSTFNNDDKIKYIQTMYGYCLTGHNSERCFFVELGKGSNGKTVLNNILSEILMVDKFYCQATRDLFVKGKKGHNQATPYLEQILNCRTAVFSETENDDTLNESDIKAISGDSKVNSRALYGNNKTVEIKCKLILETNHKLNFKLDDQTIIDRFKYIEFDQRFVKTPKNKGEHKRDPEFIQKLRTDYLDECFSFFVDGAIEWHKNGLNEPKCMLDKTNEYLNESTSLELYVSENLNFDKNKKIKVNDLYRRYVEFCDENDDDYLDKKTVKQILLNKYQIDVFKSGGNIYYQGIHFKLNELDY